MHLWWEVPPAPDGSRYVAAAVDCTVTEPPATTDLYFWALQVDFAGPGGRRAGGAHTGLQWHPGHPGHTAVNWGGYRPDGRELDGSTSELPSATGNVNTRDYRWRPGRTYRLRAALTDRSGRQGHEAWEATVVDVDSGGTTTIRDLYVPGDRIVSAVVWAEVFAPCDAPSVTVRWSGLSLETSRGRVMAPSALRVSYQGYEAGGCSNTTSWVDGAAVLQRTGSDRTVPAGAVLDWPGS